MSIPGRLRNIQGHPLSDTPGNPWKTEAGKGHPLTSQKDEVHALAVVVVVLPCPIRRHSRGNDDASAAPETQPRELEPSAGCCATGIPKTQQHGNPNCMHPTSVGCRVMPLLDQPLRLNSENAAAWQSQLHASNKCRLPCHASP